MPRLNLNPDKIYIIMNKPCGYVCSAVSDSHKTVYELLTPDLRELVQDPIRGERLHTVGRLDANTSGLLLFTNDGHFSHELTTPENKVEKKYFIKLKNEVNDLQKKEYINAFQNGITLKAEKKGEAFTTSSSILEFESDSTCFVTITEGKFHQVRRMISAVGNDVVELKRLSVANYVLPDDLEEGEYINLHYPMIKLGSKR